ncbi:MAG: hypothetical protein GWP91_22330 [Rhodobacterales bacterium]|nr:hypothetical protein [Rhodobacterales bacterium]
MKRLLPIALLIGCTGLTARNLPTSAVNSPTANTTVTSPWDIPPDEPSFTVPDDWAQAGETWRLDIRDGELPHIPPSVWDFPRELAMEILVEDAPTLSVRLAYVQADSAPPQHDYCGATISPPTGELLNSPLGDLFSIDVGPGVDLGQAWTWQHVQITGRMNRETGELLNGWWLGVVEADSMATALNFDEYDACSSLRDVYLDCVPCSADADQMCVLLEVPMTGTREIGFVVEPLNQHDVDASTDCTPVSPI